MLQDPKYIPPLAAFNEKYIMIPMQNSGRNVIVFFTGDRIKNNANHRIPRLSIL